MTSLTAAKLNHAMPVFNESQPVSRGFPPVIGTGARVLLLGSLPGRASLQADQYYAQPRNSFWFLMNALCSAGPDLSYAERLAALKRAGIALWDVLHAAQRPGSLDANIVAASEQINDVAGLVSRYRSIELIAFNGKKAAAVFARHIESTLTGIEHRTVTLPSSSPAFAAMRREQKLEVWRTALAPYLATA